MTDVRDQREAQIERQHGDDDAEERQHVREQADHAGREEILQHRHIVLDARHQPPNAHPVVGLQAEHLHVPEERGAQIEDHPVADARHQVEERPAREEDDDERSRGRCRRSRRASGSCSWPMPCRSRAPKSRDSEVRRTYRAGRRRAADQHLPAVGPEETKQPPRHIACRTPCRAGRRGRPESAIIVGFARSQSPSASTGISTTGVGNRLLVAHLHVVQFRVQAAERRASPRACRARRSAPRSSTQIWSALRTLLSRWAMMKVVRPSISTVERLLNLVLRLHIHAARRVVENRGCAG